MNASIKAREYEFSIGGVNFNGHAKIKTLTLDTNAYNDHAYTLHDASDGEDYQVPVGKVFISFQALVWLEQIAMVGRIGESTEADGVIDDTGEVLKLANGTLLPFMVNCVGVFSAGKYITAESDSGNDNYTIKSGSVLYGIETDA